MEVEETPVVEVEAAETGKPDFRTLLRNEAEILLQQQVVLDRMDDLKAVIGMLEGLGIYADLGSVYIAGEGQHVLALSLRDTEAEKLKVILAAESIRRFGGTDAEG